MQLLFRSSGVLCLLALFVPAVLEAQASNAPGQAHCFNTLSIAGGGANSHVDRFAGDDLLPYTADDFDLPEGGNAGGSWGGSHIDLNGDAKITEDEHIFTVLLEATCAGCGDHDDAQEFSSLSRPEYGVLYESEDWYDYHEARNEGPSAGSIAPGWDFEHNDRTGWCGESNAFLYNNLGANQHGKGKAKYYFENITPGSPAAAAEPFVYDEIEGWTKTLTFVNVADDTTTEGFNERGECRRDYYRDTQHVTRGYMIPVEDLPDLRPGSLPSLFGWETVDLATYFRDTIAPKLDDPDLYLYNGIGLAPEFRTPLTHVMLIQIEGEIEVNIGGSCGSAVCEGEDPQPADPAQCQAEKMAAYWGIAPSGAIYRMSHIQGFNSDGAEVLYGPGTIHPWVNQPEDGSARNVWLYDHFWRDDTGHFGKYTFEPAATAWRIVPDPLASFDNSNDKVLAAGGAGAVNGPLPKAIGLGESPVEVVADLSQDVTPLPPPEGGVGGGGPSFEYQIILRNGANVIAYADLSEAATRVHVGGTYDPATGTASAPASSGNPGVGAAFGEFDETLTVAEPTYSRYVLRVTPTGVSLREAPGVCTPVQNPLCNDINDFNDLDTLGDELASLALPAGSHVDVRGGATTVTIGGSGRTVVNTLVVFASPGTGPFVRGNANGDVKLDGSPQIDISDAVFIFNFLFLGGTAPGCRAASDTNAEGEVTISSGIYLLNHLFGGGPAPDAPYPANAYSQLESDKLLGCDQPHG
jgi:hypothetical protein